MPRKETRTVQLKSRRAVRENNFPKYYPNILNKIDMHKDMLVEPKYSDEITIAYEWIRKYHRYNSDINWIND